MANEPPEPPEQTMQSGNGLTGIAEVVPEEEAISQPSEPSQSDSNEPKNEQHQQQEEKEEDESHTDYEYEEMPEPANHRRLRIHGDMVRMLRELVGTSTRRLSVRVQTLTQRQAILEEDKRLQVRNSVVMFFSSLLGIGYLLLLRGYMDGPLNHWMMITLLGAMSAMWGVSRLSDVTTTGERILLVIVSCIISTIAFVIMLVVASPCSSCFALSTEEAVKSSEVSFFDMQETGFRLWHVLLKDDEDSHDDLTLGTCRRCVGNLIALFASGPQGYIMRRFGFARHHEKQEIAEIQVDNKFLRDDTGDLSAWYIHYAEEAKKRDLKNFKSKIADMLEQYGHLHGEGLAETLEDYFCSPASRFDKPDPTQFLEGLKHARFTGETEQSSNMTTSVLQRIMRGDVLKEMGVSICFILRFALLVPEDYSLEFKPISHTTNLPRMNEIEMKAHDATSELPSLIVPMIDQEVDPDGTSTKRFKKIMDLFAQLPFEKKYLYFDTKEEYLAFYRWELESTVQDDWFFPRWLMDSEKKNDIAELQAMKTKYSKDHLILKDQTSDLTLSDRSFFGTGMKYLTPLKLPGIDEDYDFQFPATAASYPYKEQRDAMRFKNKPSQQDLLKMVKHAYPRRVNDRTTMLQWRKRILQIDFAALASLAGRPEFYPGGCILYIDANSRMPMGIWVAPKSRMFLPDEGRDWEHAKWFYRVSERAGLTAHHVPESHLGWSAGLATATLQTLDPDHGIRALLKPFTLQVHSVNAAAYNMLVKNHSVLTHASGLQTLGVRGTFQLIYSGLNFSQTVPEMLAHHKLDSVIDTSSMPLFRQGRRLYEAHHKWVKKFVSLIYPSDEAMMSDDSIVRFWYHISTQGRHNDPCVCDLPSDLFFDDTESKWPGFETTHTCAQLLDFAAFLPENNMNTRRQRWCSGYEIPTYERLKTLYNLFASKCEARSQCHQMSYGPHYMRNGMGMQQLRTREQLINFLATNIWHVTAGHQYNGDNIPYFSDPYYSGVRFKEFDENGEPPLKVDIGSYVFGTAIAALTTVRGPPLLADWTPLYSYYASTRKDLSGKERHELLIQLTEIHKDYKFELVDLSKQFFQESIKRRVNQRNNNFIPATQGSSVSV